MKDASSDATKASWKQYYSSMADPGQSEKFQEEFHRTAFTHSWRNSVRIIGERGRLADGARVLDAGCGWGRMLLGLFDEYSSLDVTALDVQQDALDLGARLFQSPPNDNRVTWTVGDLEAIDQADDTFDVAYSARVFQHLASPSRGVAELVRVLKPGGRFVIFLQNRLCPLNVRYYSRLYSPGQVRAWFDGLDLESLSVASMDFYPNQLARLLPVGARMAFERTFEGLPVVNQIGGKTIAWGVK